MTAPSLVNRDESIVQSFSYDPPPPLRWTPGGSVGAGGAFTGGVNKLPPVGLMLFSVGEGGGAVVVELVVVVVVVCSGAFCSLAHAAIVPIAMTAAIPATAESRRGKWLIDVMCSPICISANRTHIRRTKAANPATGRQLRSRPSSTARVPDRPSRVAPASSIAMASAALRIPPLALTFTRGPTVAAISWTARTDAPPLG